MHNQALPFRSTPLRRLLAVALLLTVAVQIPVTIVASQVPGVLYVDAAAPPGGDGTSWATAFNSLQDALAVAQTGSRVWLAAGVYRPSAETCCNDPRSATFVVAPGVSLYGGFAPRAGLNTWEERDPIGHPAVLSGDLGGDDVDPNGDGVIDSWQDVQRGNAYHVLYLDGTTGPPLGPETVLDGLIVTAGMADGAPFPNGGGIYCDGQAGGECSPTLSNLVVAGNRAEDGAGILNNAYSGASSPILRHVTLRGNYASGDGGGMMNMANFGTSSPLLVDVTFEANEAAFYGGGLMNDGYQGTSSPTLLNASFYANRAGSAGGAIMSRGIYGGTSSTTLVNGVFAGNQAVSAGGGIYNEGFGGLGNAHTIINATFTANSAEHGGGVYNNGEQGTLHLSLVNAVLWGNTAAAAGGQLANQSATVVIAHSDIQGSGGSAAWDPALGTDGGGNLDAPPGFVREPDPGDGDWATPAGNDYGDLHVHFSSPIVDAGDNAALPADEHDLDEDGDTAEPLPIDRDGHPRIVARSVLQPAVVDMGAYEASSPLADLSLAATVSPEQVTAGTTLVYSFRITNHGPDDAGQVTLVDSLSPASTFEAASPGCLLAGAEVTCGPAALPAGMDITYQVTVTLGADVPASLVNTARVSGAELDPSPGDNEVTLTTEIAAARFLCYLPALASLP